MYIVNQTGIDIVLVIRNQYADDVVFRFAEKSCDKGAASPLFNNQSLILQKREGETDGLTAYPKTFAQFLLCGKLFYPFFNIQADHFFEVAGQPFIFDCHTLLSFNCNNLLKKYT